MIIHHPKWNIAFSFELLPMNIPTALLNELKLYLKHRTDNGDLEAKTLLTQIEQFTNSPTAAEEQGFYSQPPEGLEVGC